MLHKTKGRLAAVFFRFVEHARLRRAAALTPTGYAGAPYQGACALHFVPVGASRSSHRSSLPARACRRLGPPGLEMQEKFAFQMK